MDLAKLLSTNNLAGAITITALPVAFTTGDRTTQFLAFAAVVLFGLVFVFTTSSKAESIQVADVASLPTNKPITRDDLVKPDPNSAVKVDHAPIEHVDGEGQ